ncbi:hypothetical protein VWX97_03100 [Phaeobacter sp. JH18-32]|uniref:hypothetical protein n=1 Tax=Phaeobacter TaxID=302485 RepID=UPI003A844117
MAAFGAAVFADDRGAGAAVILSPGDGDILSSPVAIGLSVPQGGKYHLRVNGVRSGSAPLPTGAVSLTLDLPTGLHQLSLSPNSGGAFSAPITILIDRVIPDEGDSCFTCGGLARSAN